MEAAKQLQDFYKTYVLKLATNRILKCDVCRVSAQDALYFRNKYM